MKDWWLARSGRERRILLVAAVLVSLMLLWALVLQPMAARQSALQARVAVQRASLLQLAEARDMLAARAARPSPAQANGDRSMASLVEQGLRMAGLAASIRRIEPLGDHSVSLVLEQASFDLLVQWLQNTRLETGLSVAELRIDSSGGGAVNARLRLSAGS